MIHYIIIIIYTHTVYTPYIRNILRPAVIEFVFCHLPIYIYIGIIRPHQRHVQGIRKRISACISTSDTRGGPRTSGADRSFPWSIYNNNNIIIRYTRVVNPTPGAVQSELEPGSFPAERLRTGAIINYFKRRITSYTWIRYNGHINNME